MVGRPAKQSWEQDRAIHDIVEWDTANWGRALAFWRRHSRLNFGSVRALEIGCGNGGLSLWIALQGGECLCTDVGGPRPEAKAKHLHYGVSERIRYEALDATAMSFENEFDVVLFKSVLGGVGHHGRKDRQRLAMDAIFRALKPGGELLFAENLVASPIHQLLRKRCTSWGDYWCYLTMEEMAAYAAQYAEVEMMSAGCVGAFGRTEGQRRFLGALDRLFMERVVPGRWRYLAFGVARKQGAATAT